MKFHLQWTQRDSADWRAFDQSEWIDLPKLDEPAAGQLGGQINQEGRIFGLKVQGVDFGGYDHYCIRPLTDDDLRFVEDRYAAIVGMRPNVQSGSKVIIWNDDPIDWPIGTRYAREWLIPDLFQMPEMRNAWSAWQHQRIYAENLGSIIVPRNGELHNWTDFVRPAENETIHGIWVEDLLAAEHKSAQKKPSSYYHWTESLPAEEVEDGRLRNQRALGRYNIPKGTITYNLKDTTLATGVHVVADNDSTAHEYEQSSGTATLATISINIGSNSEIFGAVFTTLVSNPNVSDWPNGPYRCQLNVVDAGTDITYDFGTVGGAAGHFANVDSGLTADNESWESDEGPQSGTGNGANQLFTNTIDPASGAAGDRWECLLAAGNSNTHKTENLDLDVNDGAAFSDGPWAGGGLSIPIAMYNYRRRHQLSIG